MFSRLPPELGGSVKVVFDSVEPGSALAQRLYHEHQAQISQFQSKARQAHILSAQPSSHMVQVLPGGGQMRYSMNNGQEILTVRLNPVEIRRIVEEETERKIVTPLKIQLAVDVLFTPQFQQVAEIFSFTSTPAPTPTPTPTPAPEDPADWWKQSGWVNIYQNTDPSFFSSYSRGIPPPRYAWVYGIQQGSQGSGLMLTTQVKGYSAVDGPFDPDAQAGAIEPFDGTGEGLPGKSAYISRGIPVGIGSQGRVYWASAALWRIPSLGGGSGGGGTGPDPDPEDEEKFARELHSYFDTVNIAALIVTPPDPPPPEIPDPPLEALSTGESTDGRLRALTSGSATASRTLSPFDPAPANVVGAGFVVEPLSELQDPPLADPQPIMIDVYVASANITKTNAYPGTKTASYAADDPTFEYDALTSLSCKIQVREFAGDPPGAVGVNVASHKRIERFESDEGSDDPDMLVSDTTPISDRQISWAFAADASWTDNGLEPADPTAPGMGELLAEMSISTDAATLSPIPRRIPAAPEWNGPADTMTKIATIEWTPPERLDGTGTAVITPA